MNEQVIPCGVCGNPVEFPAPTIRLSIGAASTAVIFEHPKQKMCPTCSTVVHMAVVGIQNVQMKSFKVAASEQPLVVPVRRVIG